MPQDFPMNFMKPKRISQLTVNSSEIISRIMRHLCLSTVLLISQRFGYESEYEVHRHTKSSFSNEHLSSHQKN